MFQPPTPYRRDGNHNALLPAKVEAVPQHPGGHFRVSPHQHLQRKNLSVMLADKEPPWRATSPGGLTCGLQGWYPALWHEHPNDTAVFGTKSNATLHRGVCERGRSSTYMLWYRAGESPCYPQERRTTADHRHQPALPLESRTLTVCTNCGEGRGL